MKKKTVSFVLICLLVFSFLCGTTHNPVKVYAANESYAKQVAGLVNRERADRGLGYLKYSSALSRAASQRAEEIVSVFDHTRPDGSSCFTVFDEYGIGYYAAGENIAAGQPNPESVMDSWMNSSGHRANILSGNFNFIGVGVVYSGGYYYWVQLFAGSNSLSGSVILADGDTPPAETESTTKATTTTTTTKKKKTTTTTTKKTTTTTKKTTITTTQKTTTMPTLKTSAAATTTTASQGTTSVTDTDDIPPLPTNANPSADDDDGSTVEKETGSPGFFAWLWHLIKMLLGLD